MNANSMRFLFALLLLGFLGSGPAVADHPEIACGMTMTGVLTTSDLDAPDDILGLEFPDGVWIDLVGLGAGAGEKVTITVRSDDFNPGVALLNSSADPDTGLMVSVVTLDIPAKGDRAQLQYTLDNSHFWTIAIANYPGVEGDPGEYSLTAVCDTVVDVPPPKPPTNLMATTLGSYEVRLSWQDNSTNEAQFEIEAATEPSAFAKIGTVPANVTGTVVGELMPDTGYTFRVRAVNSGGASIYSNNVEATTVGVGPGACDEEATTLCLQGGRFKAELAWTDFEGVEHQAMGATLPADDSGLFYFYNSDNYELLVKVLDGCSMGGHYWVFAAAATTVEFTLTVTETSIGAKRIYGNKSGHLSPAFADTTAFTCP